MSDTKHVLESNRAPSFTPAQSPLHLLPARSAALSFAGQGSPWIDTLASLFSSDAQTRAFIPLVQERIAKVSRGTLAATVGAYGDGFALETWLESPESRPSGAALAAGPVSQPMLFITQMMTYRVLAARGLGAAAAKGALTALTGHSQGLITATLIASAKNPTDAQILDVAELLALQALTMEWAWMQVRPRKLPAEATPMAAVAGLRREELLSRLEAVGVTDLDLGLQNTPTRVVLSGNPASLERLRIALERETERLQAKRKAGQHGGAIPAPRWEYLPVSAPFHSRHMKLGRDKLREIMQTRDFQLPTEDIHPLYSCATAAPLPVEGRWEAAIDAQFDLAVRWFDTLQALPGNYVLDLGPGEGVCLLSKSALKGTGRGVFSLATKDARTQWSTPGQSLPRLPNSWAVYAPRAAQLRDGRTVIDNRYSRLTGRSPILVGGMTPTTVEVPLVAAAANAGYPAELAGGGQVTEAIFWRRMDELKDALEPGRTIAFNALYLDPYLWGLHLGKTRLVQQALHRGYPIHGVTISAGIPPVEEAAALIAELSALGVSEITFKPGTVAQVKQVLKIAKATPDHRVYIHLEGGRAGGHHSWEDLQDLLLQTYGSIRRQRNVVLCVGGGIGTPETAAAFLSGEWSLALGEPAMPTDAVFLGTAVMACAEASTSLSVKQALVDAAGSPGWVTYGAEIGSMTSGRSALNADIYYLNTAGAACGRLLDRLAGDPEQIAAHRDQIIDSLNQTAKPFFGELETMSWAEVVERAVELMAIGRHGPYEDGPWLDQSWRSRIFDLLSRAEARLASLPVPPSFSSLSELDQPDRLLSTLTDRWPEAGSTLLTPSDRDWFINSFCRRPGKPVPFVPVIDADVRRWYKSDSLWYAHDDRFTADQVLVLPGPAAVSGITTLNEPVADLLARFEAQALSGLPALPRGQRRWVRSPLHHVLTSPRLSVGDRMMVNPLTTLSLQASDQCGDDLRWTTPSGEAVSLSSASEGVVTLQMGALSVDFTLTCGGDGVPHASHDSWVRGIQRVYGGEISSPPLFSPRVSTAVVPDTASYATLTLGIPAAGMPHGVAFSLCWEPLLSLLKHEDLCGELLDLVHLSNTVSTGPGWPMRTGEGIETTVQLQALHDDAIGRRLDVRATLHRGETLVATLDQQFLLRRGRSGALHAQREHLLTLPALSGPERQWLSEQGLPELPEHDHSTQWALVETEEAGETRVEGTVTLGETTLKVSSQSQRLLPQLNEWALRPTRHGLPQSAPVETVARAPLSMVAFAEASQDQNPIHQSAVMAKTAGFEGPIVHGMWTAGAALNAAAEAFADGDLQRIQRWTTTFEAPLPLGASLTLRCTPLAREEGALVVEVLALHEGQICLRAEALVQAAPTAWVFPGQGIQQQNMGMEAYGRSRAAREVWDGLDRWTRDNLGFSILHIVRNNPLELVVNGIRHVHPKGVLHLTHFTQVAMAVLAQAQVAELRESGAWSDEGLVAGHSVGEYNALGALAGVLPPEAVVETVYRRGLVMHTLVPRDETGESGYRMGVIRPHLAGMGPDDAQKLVTEVRQQTGEALEIVNFNVRGRQYAVTGTLRAIEVLASRLNAVPAPRPPWVQVPGIDVPFHSHVLRDGVEDFRQTLDRVFPARVDADRLIGRYIPNLTAQIFELTPAFIGAIADVTDSPRVDGFLARLDDGDPDALARDLLVELLAWQFASPVRWIETQDLLVEHTERLVEIGVGYQPTLANMMRSTLKSSSGTVDIFNAEADLKRLLHEDYAPPAPAPVAAAPETETPTEIHHEVVVASSDAPVADAPLSVDFALRALVANQASLTLSQLSDGETLDEVFDGVSSRRNQVLLDLGAEFGASGLDGAHTLPLSQVRDTLSARPYQGPGPYLSKTIDAGIQRAVGRAGWRADDIRRHAEKKWGFGPGLSDHLLIALTLDSREGASGRGGDLGGHTASDPAGAKALVDETIGRLGTFLGRTFAPRAAQASSQVSSEALEELENTILGPDGLFSTLHKTLGEALNEPEDHRARLSEGAAAPEEVLGEDFVSRTQPRFDARQAVTFNAPWAFIRRDLIEAVAAVQGGASIAVLEGLLPRLALFRGVPEVQQTWAWLRDTHEGEIAQTLAQVEELPLTPASVQQTRPVDDGGYREVPTPVRLDNRRWSVSLSDGSGLLTEVLASMADGCPQFRGKTVLVTGASPGSIALETVRHLLRGGAHVVVTTSRPTRARKDAYRQFYRSHAGPGSTLTVVGYNQGSLLDTDRLVDWLFDPYDSAVGASTHRIKGPTPPDLVLPFAACPDLGTLLDQGERSEAALRTMLTGVERMVAAIARRSLAAGIPEDRCHVVLPLSPNHGGMGGDGSYGVTKAGLEVLLNRAQSEHHAWGRAVSLVGATIGWVRGTGLMAANNRIAARLESEYGPVTYSAEEMGWLITGLCSAPVRALARQRHLVADLTGGLSQIDGWGQRAQTIREEIATADAYAQRLQALRGQDAAPMIAPLPALGGALPARGTTAQWSAVPVEEMVVLVGAGEIGPHGSARTRWAVETDDLHEGAVVELAWMAGLISYDREKGWIDTESGAPVEESTLADTYRDAVRACSGIRFVTKEAAGFDPSDSIVHQKVILDQEFTFEVANEAEARSFLQGDPEGTRVRYEDGRWTVTRTKGTTLRVPKAVEFTRTVGGVLPTGFDPQRYGIPADMVANVDPVSLLNLVATVDAFLSAGFTPDELMATVHPTRVANTQGSGMGGMLSLRRLYLNPVLGEDRQPDQLQESLINVMSAYAVQSYVGSYGAMVHPVAACATAALSLEEGFDKILIGKADVVVTGGFDDLSLAGMVGFGDMHATAKTEEMLAMGLEPNQMSRPGDLRRRGFVESEGGGTLLLARGDVAQKMGLPVLAVLGWAGSFADGIHTSIPAPGLGALSAAQGGAASPLAQALSRHGLTADDIGVVSKHDTSTQANDPNEADLHQRLQEALGRSPGNPLFVVSQKHLTGHPKGGAAAWQTVGMTQMLQTAKIPGNRNLDALDPKLRPHHHLVYTERPVQLNELRAGLITSLGFGHVSALLLLLHPDAFTASLTDDQRSAWTEKVQARQRAASRGVQDMVYGTKAPYIKRTDRPDPADEAKMLLDPTHHLSQPGVRR